MQEKLENYRRESEHSLSMREQNFVDKSEEIDVKREVVKRFNEDQAQTRKSEFELRKSLIQARSQH